MRQNTFKTYSRDDELYCFDSIDDLFDDMNADGEFVVGRVYYEADGRGVEPSDFTGRRSVEAILERFDEELCERVGEIADNDGSSTRTWGTVLCDALQIADERFIHTHVGNSRRRRVGR